MHASFPNHEQALGSCCLRSAASTFSSHLPLPLPPLARPALCTPRFWGSPPASSELDQAIAALSALVHHPMLEQPAVGVGLDWLQSGQAERPVRPERPERQEGIEESASLLDALCFVPAQTIPPPNSPVPEGTVAMSHSDVQIESV